MALPSGARLGPYEILAPLSAGGMEEVYRARDPRLAREVAMKVSPEEFFEDEERRQRFEREARLLAALNHPGIASIYSFEEIPGSSPSSARHLLVMELVEGEDLAVRLASGPLSLEESLSYARQIAEALEAAHEKGIVHRDLKPANVKVTPDGRVKLLDFGLAKIFEGDAGPGSSPAITKSPTLTARATAAGAILGTAAYMSPEQARGKPLDKRTDVWAFGCVLFEMLTGKRAFEGETVTDTLAAVLMKEPDWAALPPGTPEKVREILRKCLRRDAKVRLRDIGDARLDLEELAASADASGQLPFEENPAAPSSTVARNASAVSARGSRRSLYLAWAVAAAFAAAAAVFGVLVLRARGPRPVTAIRGQILLSSDELLDGPGTAAVVSPDGSRLAYVTRSPRRRLFLRPLGDLQPVEVPESEGAEGPFFSPDGKWIAFFARGKLRKAPVSGGAPVTICDAPIPRGGAWLSGDTIVFTPKTTGGLSIVSATGGEPRILTAANVGARERTHRWPAPLPGGKAVLFSTQLSGSDYDDGITEAVGIASGKRTVVQKGGAYPRWSPPGHLLFARKGTDNAGAVWSPDGREIVFASDRVRELVARPNDSPITLREMYVEPADGSGPARLLFRMAGTLAPTGFSPDGRTLAFQTSRPETQLDLGVIRLKGGAVDGEPEMILAEPSNEGSAVFSPDGRWLAYDVNDGGHGYVYVRSAAGGDAKWQVPGEMGSSPRWSRDGTLYVVRRDASIVATRVTAEAGAPVFGREERLFTLAAFEAGSRIVAGWDVSPDGQRFLVLMREGAANTPDVNHVTFATDFAEELKRLAPAGGK